MPKSSQQGFLLKYSPGKLNLQYMEQNEKGIT